MFPILSSLKFTKVVAELFVALIELLLFNFHSHYFCFFTALLIGHSLYAEDVNMLGSWDVSTDLSGLNDHRCCMFILQG